MSDWQVGDLALCVNDKPNPSHRRTSVRRGRIYEVIGIRSGPTPHSLFGMSEGLYLKGVRGVGRSGAIASDRFRKVTPPAADEFDRETIALMNRTPSKQDQPA